MLSRYAGEIAFTTASIIGYDVILTDVEGMVIAASDPGRSLGTLHEASITVLNSGEGRGFDSKDVEGLEGTLPGVTYPIEDSRGNMVGTIGISGEPERVTPFALIVKKQAEMFLREKELLETAFDRERIINRLVLELTEPPSSEKEEELLLARAVDLGFEPSQEYKAVIFHVQRRELGVGSSPHEKISEREVHHHIRKIFNNYSDLSAVLSERVFTVYHGAPMNRPEDLPCLRRECLEVLRSLQKEGVGAQAGIGSSGKGINHLAKSYREARLAVSLGPRLRENISVHSIDDLRIEEIFYASEERLLDELVRRQLGEIREAPEWMEERKTFLAWCSSGFNIQKASALLNIHRNTFTYRLERLQEKLGKDLRDFRQVMEIYLATEVDRMISEPPGRHGRSAFGKNPE